MAVLVILLAILSFASLVFIGARLDLHHKEVVDKLGLDGRFYFNFPTKQFLKFQKWIFQKEYTQLQDKVLTAFIYIYQLSTALLLILWIGVVTGLIS